jgi:hypothetical protein
LVVKPEVQAEQILMGKENQKSVIENKQPTEQNADNTFLQELDATSYNKDIRQTLNEEYLNDPSKDKYLIDSLMFWKDKDSSVIIDNLKESERLKENKQINKPLNEGDIPVINPQER